MRWLVVSMPAHCEVVEMRNSADVVGYSCSRTANTQCSDCGSELCESHAETCGMCRAVFCRLFVVASRAAPENRLSRSRTTSGEKKGLNKLRVALNPVL